MKLQTKVVELFGEVDDNLAQKVHNELHRLDEQPDVRIVLAISSMGGSAKAASEIIESIKAISKPVYGVVIGKAHSAAFFILQNCEERIACNNPHVTLMFHPGKMRISDLKKKGIMNEDGTWNEKYAEPGKQYLKIIGEVVGENFVIGMDSLLFNEHITEWSKRSGKTVKELKKYCDQALSPQLALELGILDGLDKYLAIPKTVEG